MNALSKEENMGKIAEEVKECRRCELWRHRHKPVVGEGSVSTTIMFVGEAPGYHEDLQGHPFVGSAGELLNESLSGTGLSRDKVYITNLLKCRPPNNRDPRPEEVEVCGLFLDRQIKIIKPRLIVALGRHSASYILPKVGRSFRSMAGVHGKKIYGRLFNRPTTVVPTYHPAAALYNPKYRDFIERDLRVIGRELKRYRARIS